MAGEATNADGGNEGGNGKSGTDGRGDGENLSRVVGRAIRRAGGNASKAVLRAEGKNFELRGKIREKDAEIDRLKKLVPADGSVILTGDDAKVFKEIQGLGLSVSDIKTRVTEYPSLKQTAVTTARRTTIGEMASTMDGGKGWDPDVLDALVDYNDLHVEWKDVPTPKKNAKGETVVANVRTPHCRPASDEKAALRPLAEFVDQTPKAKVLLSALRQKQGAGAAGGGNGSSGDTGEGAEWVDSGSTTNRSTGSSSKGNDEFWKPRTSGRNPLAFAFPTVTRADDAPVRGVADKKS